MAISPSAVPLVTSANRPTRGGIRTTRPQGYHYHYTDHRKQPRCHQSTQPRHIHHPSPSQPCPQFLTREEGLGGTIGHILELCVASHHLPTKVCASNLSLDAPPGISISHYVLRLERYLQVSLESLVLAVVLIHRLETFCGGNVLSPLTAHKTILAATVVASKMHDDGPRLSAQWVARVGGLTIHELNAAERDLVKFLDFRLYVTEEAFDSCLMGLRQTPRTPM